MYQPKHFTLEEVICPHLYYKHGEWVWQFFDQRLLEMLDWIREELGRPVYLNNWDMPKYINSEYLRYIRGRVKNGLPIINSNVPASPAGLFDERGVRCNLCNLYVKKTEAGVIYISPHGRWQGADFDVAGMTAEEVRQWLVKNQARLPYSIRLERGVSWVHMDVVNSETKVQLINP